MKKITIYLFSLFIALAVSSPSWAISISDAKAQGLVGETSQGYLASVKGSPSGAIKSLVSSVNQKRKAAYKSKAAQAGVSIAVMAQRVAQRLQQKGTKGSYFRNAGGQWSKK